MNIGIILPTRGDRPQFLDNSLRMLAAQTLQPIYLTIEGYKPESEKRDITQRYRRGYEKCEQYSRDKRTLDFIALWEDDDYYAPDYLETMTENWLVNDKPDIFGTEYTIYYHIKLRKYFTMVHKTRASAMNTLIKPGLKINWPIDEEPFTDLFLWIRSDLKGKTFNPGRHISIGIKHGVGMTGGKTHVDRFQRYEPPRGTYDLDFEFLKKNMDPASFRFYSNYFPVTV